MHTETSSLDVKGSNERKLNYTAPFTLNQTEQVINAERKCLCETEVGGISEDPLDCRGVWGMKMGHSGEKWW